MSQHSRVTQGVVSHADVWGGVAIYQVERWVISRGFTDSTELIVPSSCPKPFPHEPHLLGTVVFLLQLRYNHFKRRQFHPTSSDIACGVESRVTFTL